jgi:NADPH:quinone reductase-like Zn-dependent oxidoreductase
MKAVVQDEFGSADVLQFREVADPIVGPDQLLVEVRATSVNPVDWKIREGYLQGAFPHNLPNIPGWDVAGVVKATGPAVTKFAVGDEVIAYARKHHVQNGTYAELVAVDEDAAAAKPSNVDFATAAALPLAGLTALQSLKAAGTGEGDTVLVHAAAGGVGHLAVQIAKALGAEVVGTASARNHDYLRSLGAVPVEYGTGLPQRIQGKVDVAVDFVGGEALTDSFDIVNDPSRVVTVVDAETAFGRGGRYVFVRPYAEELTWLAQLVDEGKLVIDIAESFPLERAADAHRSSEQGHTRGKIAITV